MVKGKKVIVVLPAYNAAVTLAKTLTDLPMDIVDGVILVDDASTDTTVSISRQLGLKTIVHEKNRGYGANQKTCYIAALADGADIVVMVHPDFQYDPLYVKELVQLIADEKCDAAFGSRMLNPGGAREGGMPYWKYVANIFLTKVGNTILGLHLSEYHSGFRAYSREVLSRVNLERNSDGFIFDTEIIIQLRVANYRITEIAIPCRYFKDASTIGWWPSVRYGLGFIGALGRYLVDRNQFLPKSEQNPIADFYQP